MLLIEKSDPEKLCESIGYFSLPIHLACSHKEEHIEMVAAMLEKVKQHGKGFIQNLLTFKLNEDKQSILEIAVKRNHLKIIEAIIKDYYEDFDKPDANGSLPIHLAADNGSLAIFDILLKNKAVRFSPNAKLENPLHLAANKNRFAFIEAYLKEEQSWITDLDDEGKTCHFRREKKLLTDSSLMQINLENFFEYFFHAGIVPNPYGVPI